VAEPDDNLSKAVLRLFFHVPFEYGQHGLVGFKYEALKDFLKWHGYSRKQFVPIFISCMNAFVKGLREKA